MDKQFLQVLLDAKLRRERALAWLRQHPAMLLVVRRLRNMESVSITQEEANLMLHWGIISQDENGVYISDFVEDIVDRILDVEKRG
jgi:hypothetical protein